MAMHALGEQFDIHGGGLDLQFPHHENEIAQSEGATHKTYANYWLHVGMLQLNHEKMSKSTGNFLTIQDALKQHHPEVIRYFLLSSHYRSPLNYSEDTVTLAQKALTRLYQSIRDFKSSSSEVDVRWFQTFNQAMADDFNTPIALSVLFDLSHEINKTRDEKLGATLKHLANILGLLNENPDIFLKTGVSEDQSIEIERLVQARWDARMAGQWAQADEIRRKLLAQGIEIEDGVEGSAWRRV
jgi:cysteinyl-tRNA synthetase